MNAVFSWNDLVPLAPELFLVAAGVILLLKGAFMGANPARLIGWAAVASFVIAGLLLAETPWTRGPVLAGMITLDPFAAYLKFLVLGGMAATLMLAFAWLEREGLASSEYYVLHVFACVGIMVMISATSMLSFYVGLELQSLSIYVLAAIRKDRGDSSEAGLKYFVLGALASGMLLFGISLLYGFAGAVDFAAIDHAMRVSPSHSIPMIVGLVFILAGLAFKISAVPFHMWTPDVYEGAPAPVTALMAIVPKAAALAVLMRVVIQPFGSIVDEWQPIIWFLAAASMIWSSFAALAQVNLRRLLAYSSIGNMGYALMGIAAANVAGISSVLVYLTIYMAMTAGVFAIVAAMRRGTHEAGAIDDLAGLSRTRPVTAYTLAILMFSISGIPPMAGFFGKLVVFQAALAAGQIGLAIIGVVMSVVAAFYYLRLIKVMFFDEPATGITLDLSGAQKIVLGLSVVFTLLFIVRPDAIMAPATAAARSFVCSHSGFCDRQGS